MSPRHAMPLVARFAGLLGAIGLFAPLGHAAPLDRFWPQYRHDAQRSSFVAAPGNITKPAVRWRFFLGGGLGQAEAADIDFDGHDEVLAIEGGHVTARSWTGDLRWSTPALDVKALRQLVDLTGDGVPELVATGPNAAHVIATTTGAVIWSSPAGLLPALGFVATTDFDGDGIADLAVAPNGGAGTTFYPTTHFFRFVGTPEEFATTPIPSPGIDAVVSGRSGAVDVDGDGVADLLQAGVQHLYAFQGKTGVLLAQSATLTDLSNDHQTIASVASATGTPPLLVYGANDNNGAYHLRGAYVLQRQQAALTVLWSCAVADLVSDRFLLYQSTIGDLDGDGAAEMLFGRFSSGQWQLEARDLLTGNVLTTADASAPWLANSVSAGGPVLRGALRLGQDGPLVLRVSQATVADPAPFAHERLLTWSRSAGFQQLADLDVGLMSTATWLSSDNVAIPAPIVVALSAGTSGVTDLVMLRDLDGDSAADRMDLVRVTFSGQVTTQAQMALITPVQPLTSLMDVDGTRKLLISSANGHCAVLDAALLLVNDADGDGQADLLYGSLNNPHMTVAPVKDADPVPLVLTAVGDQLVVLDPAQASPVTPPAVRWTFRSGAIAPRADLADLDGDGTREVLVRHQPKLTGATLSAFTAAGKPLWDYVHPHGPWAWSTLDHDAFAVADVDGDCGEDAVAMFDPIGPLTSGQSYTTVVSGRTGQPLWAPHAECAGIGSTSFAVDASVKPARIDWSYWTFRFLCDGATGKLVHQAEGKFVSYGLPMIRDLDGDGLSDHVLGGAGNGMTAESVATSEPLWVQADPDLYHAAAVLLPAGTGAIVASCSNVAPVVTARDARTGELTWRRAYVGGIAWPPAHAPESAAASMGLVAVADLTGLGHPSLLFRTGDGLLYAVNALNGSVDWALDWGGTFGDPVPADLDGDGLVEVLVPFSDGYLYALGQYP